VTQRVAEELELPCRYVYMGANLQGSSHALPHVRLVARLRRGEPAGPPVGSQAPSPSPPSGRRRLRRGARATVRLVAWLCEEWYRQGVAEWHRRRGRVVLFDRHFYSDYHATEIAGGPHPRLSRRIHGYVLQHWYPRPELVVYLDAPATVLFARKGEGTVAWLEQRRQDYLAVCATVPRAAVVDAARPLDAVVADVRALIEQLVAERSASLGAPTVSGEAAA
jgi:hypothetical protein